MEELRIFFWGIFKDIETLKEFEIEEPDSFEDAITKFHFGCIQIELKGKLAIWKSASQFYSILGKLAIIEKQRQRNKSKQPPKGINKKIKIKDKEILIIAENLAKQVMQKAEKIAENKIVDMLLRYVYAILLETSLCLLS